MSEVEPQNMGKAEGDKVVTRYTIQCTHMGAFMGISATGKQITAKGLRYTKEWE